MTTIIDPADPRATAAVEAIHEGDVPRLRQLLADHPDLATSALGNTQMTRSLLHVATDWPGHYPNGPQVIAALVDAGADVGARFTGPHAETPLHWAASSDDLASAFWGACHGGHLATAQWLLEEGADRNWIAPWDRLTPLDAARSNGFDQLAEWLANHGCVSANTS